MFYRVLKAVRHFRERLKDRHFRFAVTLYFGAGAIILLFALPLGLTVSSSPSFCAACHSMNPEYQTWKRSSHAQLPCYGCHGPRSYTKLLYGKIFADSKGPFQEVTGFFEQPVNESSHLSQEGIPMGRCERCHANENRRFTFSKGIKMNHTAHKEAGIDCTVCHNRVVHKGAERYEPLRSWDGEFKYTDFLTMKDGCFRCHSGSPESRDEETLKKIKNDKKPPQACNTCHTKDFALPIGHGRDQWRSEHGAVAVNNVGLCLDCHGEKARFSNGDEPWCTLCHDQPKVEKMIGWKRDGEE